LIAVIGKQFQMNVMRVFKLKHLGCDTDGD